MGPLNASLKTVALPPKGLLPGVKSPSEFATSFSMQPFDERDDLHLRKNSFGPGFRKDGELLVVSLALLVCQVCVIFLVCPLESLCISLRAQKTCVATIQSVRSHNFPLWDPGQQIQAIRRFSTFIGASHKFSQLPWHKRPCGSLAQVEIRGWSPW